MNNLIKKIALAITLTGIFCNVSIAQDQPQAQGKSEATIGLSYYKKADMTKTAVAIIKTKNKEGKFVAAKNAKVNFYVMHDKVLEPLKSANTDNKGQAVIELQKGLPLDENLAFTIVAKIENDKAYENAEEEMHYKDATITLKLNPNDSADRTVTAMVTELDKDGKVVPVKGAEVKFYTQRMFGFMPAAEENTISTNENGEASFTYPKDIPGDTAGIVNVVVRMDDNEQFGNVESKSATTWGTHLAIIKDPFPRALWEPFAPWPLVITLSILFGGVWSTYFFIFLQLRKIKKEGNAA